MNPDHLIEQFLGPEAAPKVRGGVRSVADHVSSSGLAGVAGGLAAGGVLGMLIGNKRARAAVGKLAGGVVGYGGAAALGALAYRAYQNWGGNASPVAGATLAAPNTSETEAHGTALLPPAGSKFIPGAAPASDGRPFEIALVKAMIAAANADGHIGVEDQWRIFGRLAALPLNAGDKALVFDAIKDPPSIDDIAALASGVEQATELYLASRLVLDPAKAEERAYLAKLADRLLLPETLVAHLDAEASRPETIAA